MIPKNQRGGIKYFNNRRVACAVRGREDKDRELTVGFYRMMVLSDSCIPTAPCDNSSNITLNNNPSPTVLRPRHCSKCSIGIKRFNV